MLSNQLGTHYGRLEMVHPVKLDPSYSDLVVPNVNSEEAFHRWFHIKEGFSCKLTQRVLEDTGLFKQPSLVLLDSFAGGATTVVSAVRLDRDNEASPVIAYGIERNPFLRFVGETKVQALRFGAPGFREFFQRVANLMESEMLVCGPIPALSTFHKEEYFLLDDMIQLVRLKSAIAMAEGSKLERDLARVCMAGTIEPVSALRRDGRALRYVSGKPRARVVDEFLRRATIVAEDLEISLASSGTGHVYLGDGRRPADVLPPGIEFDVVLFSPPYPNNIDYTEVYKLEAWLLDFITGAESFRRQRLSTLRSHPSVRFPDSYCASRNGHRQDFDALLAPLLHEIPRNGDWVWRQRLIMGYFDDMLETLLNHKPLLAERGRLVFVVGNSLHGSGEERFLIAADLIIAGLATMVGYEVEQFVVARPLTRKAPDLPLLRESVVFLRKAES